MEIITYAGSESDSGFSLPQVDLQIFNLRHLYRSVKGRLSVISVDAGKIWVVLWLAVTLFLAVFVPFGVVKLVSHFNSFASPVEFENQEDELDVLDTLMSRFAMAENDYSFDENGNVILADGTILKPSAAGIGKTVAFQTYKVKSGESISTITRKFGLSNISTLIALNGISNVKSLREGQTLKIPSFDGLIHKVGCGESLTGISGKYHVSVEELCDANDLSSQVLKQGQELFIPGARMAAAELKKAMGELFANPISAKYRLTSYFGPRKDPFTGVASNHTGIDMACPTGTPIGAMMSGKVVVAGWSNVFGNYVIISHGNGYQSLYGHMSKITVKKGAKVEQGQKIGLVGNTGYSTGSHLHLTVYKNGKLTDPLSLIRR